MHISWLLRGLLVLGGALLIGNAWPVALGAWYTLHAADVIGRLRNAQPVSLPDFLAAIDAYDHAVQADPGALRHLDRSELLVGAAIGLNRAVQDSQREQWLRSAQSDLETGLGGAPAHGIAWLRLASVRQILEGPSQRVVEPLLMSIETAAVVPRLWPARLELILRNWPVFSAEQRHRVGAYVVMTWQASNDRGWFIRALHSNFDELFLRLFLNDVPGAQEELSRRLMLNRR